MKTKDKKGIGDMKKKTIENASFIVLMLIANSIGIIGIQMVARYLNRL